MLMPSVCIRRTAILLDLDGTLTDPVEGITRCIRHALEGMGAASPPLHQLQKYIGPPLRQTFPELLNDARPETVERAVALYRERFASVGLFENTLYPGIPQMLQNLHQQGKKLYLATAKPHPYARRILDHFGLACWFTAVYGSELNGDYDDKGLLIQRILQEQQIRPEEAVMIGDRAFDIEAAHRSNIAAAGVLWGYGSAEELKQADYLCRTPQEVEKLIEETP